MNSNKPLIDQSISLPTLLFITIWLVSGCSESSESVANDTQSPIESSTSASDGDGDGDGPTSTSNTSGNEQDTEVSSSGNSSPIDSPNTSVSEEDNELGNDTDGNVVESGTDPVADNSYALNDVAQDLLLSLAGYQADQLTPLVDELTASAIDGLEGESLESTEITLFDAQSDTSITEPVTRVRYNCAGGGTVTRETGSATFVNANIFRLQRLDGYVFDQCIHGTSGITLPDDSYTTNGSLNIVERRFSTSGFASTAYAHTWNGFSLQALSAASYELEGIVTTSTTLSSSGNSSSRTSEMDLYRKTQAEETGVSIEGGVFKLTRSSNGGGSIQNYDVDIDGSIASLDTNGQTVKITTDPVLSRQRGVGFSIDSNIPFSGKVEFLSDDGSFLYLAGNPTAISSTGDLAIIPDFVTLNLIDLAYTSATGEKVETAGVALNPFTVVAPNCDIVRNETTDNIECDGDESFVVP